MISLGKDKASIKLSVANVVVVANAFVWYLVAFYCLKISLSNQGSSELNSLQILGANTAAIAVAGLIGTLVVGRLIDRRRFLFIWIASGIALSLLPLVLNMANLSDLMILSLVFGAYFGIGMPATMSYYSSLTKVENRARIGGFTFLIIGTTFALSSIITQSSLFQLSIFLVVVRIIGLIALCSIKHVEPKPINPVKEIKVKYSGVFTNKHFLLYFAPWLMFTIINYTTIPIQQSIVPDQEAYAFLAEIENIVIAVSAVISGFVADKMGRKRLSIIGFVLLGIGYAVLGLATTNPTEALNMASSQNLLARIVYMLVDGLAWGIFYVLFVFTLWGDLAQNRQSDKFYFLGVLPYVSAYFMQLIFTPSLSEIDIKTIFSFASVFLFLAILPLIYAPETLPEKTIKDRELKNYIENAKKKAAKEVEKVVRIHKLEKEQQKSTPENDESYDEAKKLAEKYY